MSLKEHLEKSKASLPSATEEQLKNELEKRRNDNIFPLEVFNEKLKPLIDFMHTKIDTPRSYIGLAMLSSYSSAIGTSYVVKNAIGEICLVVWACYTGTSSSGKSTALNFAYKPLVEIQREYTRAWNDLDERDRTPDQFKHVLYKDVHLPTLIKDHFPSNPKGLTKQTDEILEWINGLNSYSKKESTDEQFWLSSWNCLPHSGARSGRQTFSLEKTFNNIYGGIQPSLLKELFKNNRGTSGFIFRLLFTNPHESRISDPDTYVTMPPEFAKVHNDAIRRLYIEKPVNSHYQTPEYCIITEKANDRWNVWCKKKASTINKIPEIKEREIAASIYGKMKEYSLRFAAILHLMDKALDEGSWFESKEYIQEETMIRALQLAEYFFVSAQETYEYVESSKTVPMEVLDMANLKKKGFSFEKIAEIMYGNKTAKSKVHRNYLKWLKEYPKQFNSEV